MCGIYIVGGGEVIEKNGSGLNYRVSFRTKSLSQTVHWTDTFQLFKFIFTLRLLPRYYISRMLAVHGPGGVGVG